MALCLYCFESFIKIQTFQNFFAFRPVCQNCQRFMRVCSKESVLPISNGLCTLSVFEAGEHSVFLQRLLEKNLCENEEFLVLFEPVFVDEPLTWTLVEALFKRMVLGVFRPLKENEFAQLFDAEL